MDTKTDLFGREVTKTERDGFEVYTLPSGLAFTWRVGHGWDRALTTINKAAPIGWTPPEMTEG